DEVEEYDEGRKTITGYTALPYKQDRMIPKVEKSKSGRANPEGIPCLYLSDELKTALSEVRPWINEKVSIAVFKVMRDLKIIDFSRLERSHIYYFKEPNNNIKEKEVWANVNRAFSMPINIEDQAKDYIPTQIICEYIKSKGIDGIKYKSMLAEGNNFALFNLKDAIPFNGIVFEIKSIQYEFTEYSNPVEYSQDGTNTRIYNRIVSYMPISKNKNGT
ncbi:RES family NAD+ phosphorylase, partial [Candidatus Pacearchaeota archaeon]|nr:RES family NAD+ phosphorylase [Candidatus Pacearchaeota archaeon]